MTLGLFLLGAAVVLSTVARAVIEVLAARSRATHRGELAFHRHELRALDARHVARERRVLARIEALSARLDGRSGDA